MRWAKKKSTDEADCILRHLKDRGTFDSDGVRHSAKVAWRALALLQREMVRGKELTSERSSDSLRSSVSCKDKLENA